MYCPFIARFPATICVCKALSEGPTISGQDPDLKRGFRLPRTPIIIPTAD